MKTVVIAKDLDFASEVRRMLSEDYSGFVNYIQDNTDYTDADLPCDLWDDPGFYDELGIPVLTDNETVTSPVYIRQIETKFVQEEEEK